MAAEDDELGKNWEMREETWDRYGAKEALREEAEEEEKRLQNQEEDTLLNGLKVRNALQMTKVKTKS